MKKVTLSLVVAAVLAGHTALAQPPPPAPPPPPPPPPPTVAAVPEAHAEAAGEKEFGDKGTIAIGGGTSLNFGYQSTSHPTIAGSSTPSTSSINLGIMPDVQYFVIDGLSLGGTLAFNWTKPDKGDAITGFGIGPTVGYNYWLTPGTLSLWPQATFTFNTLSTSASITTGTTTTSTSVTATKMNVGVFVPLLIHPVKHFHFGVGPFFNIDVSSSQSSGSTSIDGDKNMNLGIMGEVAGWL